MIGDIRICECFARDGLQHENRFVPTESKIKIIDAFTDAGFQRIEATSYSHPKHVPAFSDSGDVLRGVRRGAGVSYKASCPNTHAVRRAIADVEAGYGATEISLLTSASESHTSRNLRTTRERQWLEVQNMVREADGRFRLVGVISVAFGCPIEGKVEPGTVVEDIARFGRLGVELVTVGDTTGLATPASVRDLFGRAMRDVPEVTLVAHFHNTRGSAIANCIAALEAGCRDFDSSIGGVGGHPVQVKYGEGFTGNVATEDLVNIMESMGVDTGLDLEKVMSVSESCEQILGRTLNSMVARAGLGMLRENNSRA